LTLAPGSHSCGSEGTAVERESWAVARKRRVDVGHVALVGRDEVLVDGGEESRSRRR
jgi:hypothetical protein